MASASPTPYALIGAEPAVSELVRKFYEHMAVHEPALAAIHRCDDQGRVAPEAQERFRLFLIGWLGGPQTYMQTHGHPRLRMRHGHVQINSDMRDAWLRCMRAAIAAGCYPPEVIDHLHQAFDQMAEFLRNAPDAPGSGPT